MPFTAAIIGAVTSVAGAGLGVATSAQNSGQASAGAQTNQNIANQELANKQQVFQQLDPFYSQYMQNGSPYLQNIQRAGAEQNAQQFSNSAGQLRGQMQTSGLGYGPSGTTAAALGQMGQGAASSSANSYLQNLLNNEQVKFQAAQGLGQTGNMMNSQNTVGQTPQPVNSTIGSSANAFGQVLNGLQPTNLPAIPGSTAQPNGAANYNPMSNGTQGTPV
jgi:hypothetical protein